MPVTIFSTLRRPVRVALALLVALAGLVAFTPLAHAEPTNNPRKAVVLIDVSVKASVNWQSHLEDAQTSGEVYATVQTTGVYINADGLLLASNVAFDTDSWRFRHAITESWKETYEDNFTKDLPLDIEKVKIDTISVSSDDNPAGGPEFELVDYTNIDDGGIGYALLMPTSEITVPYLDVAAPGYHKDSVYRVFFAQYTGSRVAKEYFLAPLEKEDYNDVVRYRFESAESRMPRGDVLPDSAAGGFIVDNNGDIIAMVNDAAIDDGELFLYDNLGLRQYLVGQEVFDDVTPQPSDPAATDEPTDQPATPSESNSASSQSASPSTSTSDADASATPAVNAGGGVRVGLGTVLVIGLVIVVAAVGVMVAVRRKPTTRRS